MSAMSSPLPHARRLSMRVWMTLLVLSLGLGACQSEVPVPEHAASPSLFLELRSLTGEHEPVPGARVYLPSGEQLQSDAWGQLLWANPPEGHQLLRVESPGFAPSMMALDVGQGVRAGTRLELLPLGAPVATFNTREGATFSKADILVTVPPGKLFDPEGRALEGEVDAYLAPLDLNDLNKAELLAAPGELRGVLHPGEPPVNLESVALIVLSFQQKAGASLRSMVQSQSASRVSSLARRLGIRGSVPRSVLAHAVPPSHGQSPEFAPGALEDTTPSQVPLWSLDPNTGLWIPTGDMATLEESPTGSGQFTYEITLDHPAPLIHVARPFADHPGAPVSTQALAGSTPPWRQTVCVAVRVEDEEGQPVAGRSVMALGLDYASVSRAVTDGEGRALLEVMRDREVRLDAGTASRKWHTSPEAGTCSGQGAAPTDITLRVPTPGCVPGVTRACGPTGPSAPPRLGICQAARQACNVDGAGWTDSCGADVFPQEERCDNALDDDCDGVTNEGCPTLCAPGEKRPCYEGPEGTRDVGVCHAGLRTCVAEGTAWSACEGQVLPETEDCDRPGDENCDGVVCQCRPEKTRSCAYTGPERTEGVGVCHAGTQTCEGSGWSACTGEVTPQAEDCATAADEDCTGDGHDALSCVCVPGTSEPCYSGPSSTKDVGVCHAGTRTCEASGTAWGACTGEVTPQAEDCATAADEDCTGGGRDAPSCVCVPGASEACYSGPPGTKDVGVCHAGTHTCEPSGVAWGACMGESTPQTEVCFNSADEDCDGSINNNPPCSWSATASMASPHASHTATLLGNGKVLVSGGTSNTGSPFKKVEVYDPSSNTWSSASSMGTARSGHTATLLGNGKVLVSGGRSTGGTYLGTTEVYDPASNTWSSASSMGTARSAHTATLLGNGKVLVSGGESTSSYLDTAEVYDPASNTWSPADTMKLPRSAHTATLLSNGKVLVSGGFSDTLFRRAAEVYDPASNTWSSVDPMVHFRRQHTATLLSNGKVLVSGGQGNANVYVEAAEVYDPVSQKWSPAGNMTVSRYQHTAMLLNDGKVLVSGGLSDGSIYLKTAEVYDPVSNAWSPAGDMTSSRSLHTSALMNDGRVLIVGGTSTGGAIQSAELYSPPPSSTPNTWTARQSMNTPRSFHTETLLGNGKVLVSGGKSSSGVLATAELYDRVSNTWSPAGTMATPRFFHTATRLANGKVLISGGQSSSGSLTTAELYDPASNTWSPAGTMSTAHLYHTATRLGDGRVLVTGGDAGGQLATAEIYDPSSNTWGAAQAMATARAAHTAVLLSTGRVLVSGGHSGSGSLATAEVYDPVGNTWSSTGMMASPHDFHTATLLGDGRVLVTGGYLDNTSYTATAEIYDPGSGTWTAAAAMASPRSFHKAVRLGNGRVMVSGGDVSQNVHLDTAEVYDPGSDSWASAGTLSVPRYAQTVTKLDNGQVLLSGGDDQGTADLYSP